MIGTFKQNGMDKDKIRSLVQKLSDAGLYVTLIWKRGIKIVDETDERANFAEVRLNNKWILRQNVKNGSVRLDHLEEKDRLLVLQEFNRLEMYSEPNWTLGIFLYFLYLFFIGLVAVIKEDEVLTVVLLISVVLITFGMGMLYLRAKQLIPNSISVIALILGALGYIATVPSCLLTLPLLTNIYKLHLYDQISKLD